MTILLISLFASFLQAISIPQGISASQSQLKPPASTSSEKDKCTVSGRVTSMQSGEPLKKATLHLILHSDSRNANSSWGSTGYSGTSNPDGTFKFEGVEPGEYSLSGERTGLSRPNTGARTEHPAEPNSSSNPASN